MTKLETAAVRINAIQEATLVIACQQGRIARAHNRPIDGVLVPKAIREDAAQTAEWERGWNSMDRELKGE